MAKEKIKKVVKALRKASKTHAAQAKTLDAIRLKSGGSASSVPENVANPSLYRKAKAKAKAKFDVFPSAYASGWMVQEYKRMGGTYKGAKKMSMGGSVYMDPKGCGAVMESKRKQVKVPRG